MEAREDRIHPQAGNGARDPPCRRCSGFSDSQCAKCMLYFSFHVGARPEANFIYQEEACILAHASVETVGTEVVDGTVLLRNNCESIVAFVGSDGHKGPQPQMGWHQYYHLSECHHLHSYHYHLQYPRSLAP